MTKRLSNIIRATAKQGNLVPAIVIDTGSNTASVRLSNNGAIYHSLSVTGGPVLIGQTVYIDFTTQQPTIIAPGLSYNFTQSVARPQQMASSQQSSGGGGTAVIIPDYTTILIFEGPIPSNFVPYGTEKSSYPPTESGLVDALSHAADFDCIYLPECDISLTGVLTVPSGSSINNISIIGKGSNCTILRGGILAGASTGIYGLQIVSSGSTVPCVSCSVEVTIADCKLDQSYAGGCCINCVDNSYITVKRCAIISAENGYNQIDVSEPYYGAYIYFEDTSFVCSGYSVYCRYTSIASITYTCTGYSNTNGNVILLTEGVQGELLSAAAPWKTWAGLQWVEP